MHGWNSASRYRVYSDMRTAVSTILTLCVAGCLYGQRNPAPNSEPVCSNVVLRFRLVKQPPVFHKGEVIQARLSWDAVRPRGVAALPENRRGFFREILVWSPKEDAVDPLTLDPRIHVGSSGGWSEERTRAIDVNEWIQFRRPGRYELHADLRYLQPVQASPNKNGPSRSCVLESNTEFIEILPSDSQWEAAELTRFSKMLDSDANRATAATALRYLNTPEAAIALARSYMRFTGEPVNSELLKGIFESEHADLVQAELERSLRSSVVFTENAVSTLGLLEVRRQFSSRPCPANPQAASEWSREYWALYEFVKAKYSVAAKHPQH